MRYSDALQRCATGRGTIKSASSIYARCVGLSRVREVSTKCIWMRAVLSAHLTERMVGVSGERRYMANAAVTSALAPVSYQLSEVITCSLPSCSKATPMLRCSTIGYRTTCLKNWGLAQPSFRGRMDNATFHKTALTRQIIEHAGHTLLYLPPYSPDFNPIEQDFAIMKRRRQFLPADTTIDEVVRSYVNYLE